MKRMAQENGFNAFAARGFVFPANLWFPYPQIVNKVMVKTGLWQVKGFAKDMVKGRARWPGLYILFFDFGTSIKSAKYAESYFNNCFVFLFFAEIKMMKSMSDSVSKTGKNPKTWEGMGSHIYIDEKTCNGCRVCVDLCPRKCYVPIKMTEEEIKNNKGPKKVYKIEKLQGRCVSCMRCMSYCPQNAIYGYGIKRRYHPLSLKEIQQSIKL